MQRGETWSQAEHSRLAWRSPTRPPAEGPAPEAPQAEGRGGDRSWSQPSGPWARSVRKLDPGPSDMQKS